MKITNEDNMELMSRYEDNHFDLAIVDPPYGIGMDNQKIRVKPKKGRVSIFPADFPYVHRGNPPLKKDKYILTSWFNF